MENNRNPRDKPPITGPQEDRRINSPNLEQRKRGGVDGGEEDEGGQDVREAILRKIHPTGLRRFTGGGLAVTNKVIAGAKAHIRRC